MERPLSLDMTNELIRDSMGISSHEHPLKESPHDDTQPDVGVT